MICSRPLAEIVGTCSPALKQLALGALVFVMLASHYLASEQVSSPLQTQWLVETAQRVLSSAAQFGFDEAGTRVLGPTAWKGFKLILQPVVDSLRQRYPALSFGQPQDKAAVAAANQAAAYLAQDADLQRLLVQRFDSLAASEREIIEGERRIEIKQDEELRAIRALNKRIADVQRDLSGGSVKPPSELPVWIDLSDYYEQASKVEHRNADDATRDAFVSKVAEAGKTYMVYKCKLPNDTIVAYPISEKYSDKTGQLCRNILYDYDSGGFMIEHGEAKPLGRCTLTIEACQTAGTWREEKNLRCEGDWCAKCNWFFQEYAPYALSDNPTKP